MSMVSEIDNLAREHGFTKFVSGQDNWHDDDIQLTRKKLIDKAKKGCAGAKAILMAHPHNIRTLVLDKQKII